MIVTCTMMYIPSIDSYGGKRFGLRLIHSTAYNSMDIQEGEDLNLPIYRPLTAVT